MENVSHLSCINCGKEYEPLPDRYLCDDCGDKGLLEVEYDYEKVAANWSKDDLADTEDNRIWRYRPLLPIEDDTLLPPLAVGNTPIYESKKISRRTWS